MDANFLQRDYNITEERLAELFWNPQDRDHDDEMENGERSRRRRRSGYSEEEGRKLMQFVRIFRLHSFVRGNAMWKGVAKLKLISGRRSWQSLRQFFYKTVMKRLRHYNATDEDIRRIRSGKEEINDGILHFTESRVYDLFKDLAIIRQRARQQARA